MTWQERAACLGTYKSVDFFPTDWMRGKWDDSPERVAPRSKNESVLRLMPRHPRMPNPRSRAAGTIRGVGRDEHS